MQSVDNLLTYNTALLWNEESKANLNETEKVHERSTCTVMKSIRKFSILFRQWAANERIVNAETKNIKGCAPPVCEENRNQIWRTSGRMTSSFSTGWCMCVHTFSSSERITNRDGKAKRFMKPSAKNSVTKTKLTGLESLEKVEFYAKGKPLESTLTGTMEWRWFTSCTGMSRQYFRRGFTSPQIAKALW